MFETRQGYIVSRHSSDEQNQLEIHYYVKTDEGTVKVSIADPETLFFTNAPADAIAPDVAGVQCDETQLKSFGHESVTVVRCKSLLLQQQMVALVKKLGYAVYEEDINPEDRYLMERYIRGAVEFVGLPDAAEAHFTQAKLKVSDYQPDWQVWSLDIETSVTRNELLSIGVTSGERKAVLVVSDQPAPEDYVFTFPDERRLLLAFIKFLRKQAPDILIGWNVIGFDLMFLDQRFRTLGIKPALGVNGETWRVREAKESGKVFASIAGRAVLDGITMLKVGGYHFKSYSLNHVSGELLDQSKLLTGGDRWQEIERMHQQELDKFVAYNLQDCVLVEQIFAKLQLIELQQTRVDLTGIPLSQTGGSVASFENLYLPRLHRKGWVAPAWSDDKFVPSPGGFVMSSVPGLYKNVLVFDFKSLYPSIIRTFYVDPLARVVAQALSPQASPMEIDSSDESDLSLTQESLPVPGYRGASFERQHAILPELVAELAQSRESAKRAGNDILSYAIKIIMNSFYGVLGSAVCRFYHAELASSITMRGHELLGRSKQWMEERGAKVIYGDTDSLFITLDDELSEEQAWQAGKDLCEVVNQCLSEWCGDYADVTSHLELEFETLYSRFYMPTIRGQEEGSKKRYAGLTNGELVFKGLEAARSDWTPLAKRFQVELFEHLFFDKDINHYVSEFVNDLLAGKFDHELVYTKQLTRPLSQYVKTQPPHVRAARMVDEERAQQGLPPEYERGRKRIAYCYTLNGVKPYFDDNDLVQLDYQHYIDKQVLPIAEGVFHMLHLNVTEIFTPQFNLL
ncbi:DNA polymerase II [Marinomonas ostreistagni]|uniref:DNA polymerase II n=1 Tax=Marinomonas ostreistagni TaxID=359209 RepID=UPI00194E8F50|nr:DNA polymerase II [Marinomonas ostreistagni]MBM6550020.1 DNA polymerase II [Marinomonas ostreistagni]